jgi:hypothetical protein
LIDFDPITARFYFKHWHGQDDNGREVSVSYTDSRNQKHHLKLSPEKVKEQTGRRYRLESWGAKDKQDWKDKQLSLFWFKNHEFIIYLLQSLLFMLVFYYAIVLQFPSYFLDVSSPLHILGTIIRILPIPIFLFFVPRTIPSKILQCISLVLFPF